MIIIFYKFIEIIYKKFQSLISLNKKIISKIK